MGKKEDGRGRGMVRGEGIWRGEEMGRGDGIGRGKGRGYDIVYVGQIPLVQNVPFKNCNLFNGTTFRHFRWLSQIVAEKV